MLFYRGRARVLDANGNPVPGALANFYLTTTSTRADTYQDAALQTEHENPVEANAAGFFPPIYLDADVEYRCEITDSAGGSLPDGIVDPVNPSVLNGLDAEDIGEILYPRTPAEVSSGVTPADYAYEPGDIRRYGGSTAASAATNTAAIQAAIDSHGVCDIPIFGTISFNGSVEVGSGSGVTGLGRNLTTLSYTGTAQPFVNATPGTRIYGLRFENFYLVDAGTGTVGIDLDSVSNSFFQNVTVDGFTTDIRVYSPTSGYSVYNRFHNVWAFNATDGFLITGLSSNANVLDSCRSVGCVDGVEIVDSNENHIFNGQWESGTNGIHVTRSAGQSVRNYIESNRFESNSGTNIITDHANVVDTLLSGNYHVDGTAYSDSGTRTQINDYFPNADTLPMSVQTTARPSTDGAWKRLRTAAASVPAYVIGDSNTGSGSPIQLDLVNKRGAGSFLRCRDDFHGAGSTLAEISAAGVYSGKHFLDGTITFANADATPTVEGGGIFQTTGTTAITDFDNGVVGQTIKIKATGNITITNGAPIKLAGAANFAMTADDTLTLTMFDDQVWHEIARSVN